MSRDTTLHQNLPTSLHRIADQIQSAGDKNRTVKGAQGQFLSLVRNQAGVRCLKIPFSELTNEQLPAIYFANELGNPVVIEERCSEGQFTVRFWDERISICDAQKLAKKLSPTGFILNDTQAARTSLRETLSNWKHFFSNEKHQIGLGLASSAISVTILVLFIYLLNYLFSKTFADAEVTRPALVILGVFSSLLCCFAFLQIRGVLSAMVNHKSKQLRAKQQAMPAPFPLRAAWNPTTTREWVEIACVPLILIIAGLVITWNPLSVAAWTTFLGCSLVAVVFSFKLPRLVELCFDANSFISKRTRKPELTEVDNRKPILQASDLYLPHPKNSQSPLIDQLSFNIFAGDKFGFIGAQAADTSVLLRVLTGEIKPETGTVIFDKNKAKIGWFSERAALIDGTIGDNLYFDQKKQPTSEQIETALRLSGLDQTKLYRKAGLNLLLDEAETLIDRETKTRLILARSLVNDPNLLIYDMPINRELETIVLEVLEQVLNANNNDEMTVLIGAKRGSQLAFTDKSMLLQNGKKALTGSTDLVLETFKNEIRRNTSM